MTTNQTSMMGPKARPILAVPKRCTENRAIRMATAAGITYGWKASVRTLTPSRALSTEIDGVITPSP